MQSATSHSIIETIVNSSVFPPSFEGNPWIFLAALFCTMLASLVSMTQIYLIGKETLQKPREPLRNPITIYRMQLILMYFTVLIGAGPDAVYLWTYGEVNSLVTAWILTMDRVFDSLVIIPFGLFTWLQLRCGAVLKYQLLRRAIPIDIKLNDSDVKMNILIAVIIFIMSVGVTISK